MDVLTAIMWVAFLTPMIAVLLANKRLAHFITAMLVRVWESIMILAGKPKPVVEGNVKMTLDELGITLEQASDAHYDKAQLDRIRKAHNWEHAQWTTEFNKLERPKTIAASIVEEIWDEDVDETLLAIDCKYHDHTLSCYYCDDKNPLPPVQPKRHRRIK